MLCPFLSEVQVRSCQLASVRKLIPLAGAAAGELCSSPQFAECAAFRRLGQAAAGATACPHLSESLMQYCSAAPVMRMVPWSETAVSRCGSGAYRYCDLYLEMSAASAQRGSGQDAYGDEDLPIPPALKYTANHMWLDVAEDGVCHVGLDALYARLLGPVEAIEFLTQPGTSGAAGGVAAGSQPGAVLRVDGHDWQVAFPRPMHVTACNLVLRSDPSRLTSDPYGRGWMFMGTGVDAAQLRTGAEAAAWMQDESRRLNEFVQARSGCYADGGVFESGLLATLPRRDALSLFNAFLSPAAESTRSLPGHDSRRGEEE
jgi:glycine cleavage system H lipoate-binding protein